HPLGSLPAEGPGSEGVRFIKVPEAGAWTVHATSDAGSHLRIHESQVIDDDFNHDGSTASGSILLEAGLHPFTLSYRTAEADPSLTLEWSGPGVEQEPIPDTALFRVAN
ncbi:MAG: PA14 domain-containing protein, partial [Verrucomicrobiales bacterium]|nr:PA14 domain-containing protein [Verrucomicrobiales bacterium]